MKCFLKRVFGVALLASLLLGNCLSAEAASARIVVKLNNGSLIGPIVNLLNGVVLDVIPESNTYLLQVPSIPPLLSPISLNLLGIAYIEVDTTLVAPTHVTLGVIESKSDPDWYRLQPSFVRIRADRAAKFYDGYGVVVADINSAVDYGHPSLRGHLTSGYDFVSAAASRNAQLNQSSASFLDQSSASFLDQSSASFLDQSSASFLDQSSASFLDGSPVLKMMAGKNPAYSHGTLCAGLIAAVAPRAMVMPLRVFNDEGEADLFTISKAIRYAVKNGASVINMSFGVSKDSRTIQDAVAAAIAANIVVTSSAGNANTSEPQFPAAYPSVISVAATDQYDRKASFSNYGRSISVDAPGVNIISAYPGGYYAMVSGTSFAAPIVAGEAALVRSKQPLNVRSAITHGVIDIDGKNPRYVNQLGEGRVDILSALGR